MKVEGSAHEFRENWVEREETTYSHFTREYPQNQIQLAFRNHWRTWNRLFPELSTPGRVLEVGSGRGSLSMYFSQASWVSTILDLVPEVLQQAKTQFAAHSLPVKSIVADCLDMPIADNSFDVVFSIGLLEHFTDPGPVLSEQFRVLAPGGLLVGYVVPEPAPGCVQESHEWVNDLLRILLADDDDSGPGEQKSEVFRSDYRSEHYSRILSDLGCSGVGHSGTYPLPMISQSPEFPFTLLPPKAEIALTSYFQSLLDGRASAGIDDPWLCEEEFGQAFLVWGRKPS